MTTETKESREAGLVVCVKIHPGNNWQELFVNGQRVATVWGQVTEITREVHAASPDTYCVTIGKPSDPVAFYHVNAYTYAGIQIKDKPCG